MKINRSTPETDAALKHVDGESTICRIIDLAYKLEWERDEARAKSNSYQMALEEEQECHSSTKFEYDQLMKVCDQLAKNSECCHGPGKNPHCGRCKALDSYNQLSYSK